MDERLEILVFKLGTELYGFDIKDVGEIIEMQPLVKIPGLGDSVEGVANLRDKVTTVINLRKKLWFEDVTVSENSKIILRADESIGFIVDAVDEIISLTKENIENASGLGFIGKDSLITNIAKVDGAIIAILNIKEISK